MKPNKLIPIFAFVAAFTATHAPAALSDDNKCTRGLAKAQAKYTSCMQNLLFRGSDGLTYRDRYSGCINKYAAAWSKLQTLTGTECEGPRFEDNLDGSVTDHLTGLIWEVKGNADGAANFSDPHDADNTYTLSDDSDGNLTDDDGTAYTDFLAELNAGPGFAGSSGWRLPSTLELATIVLPVVAGNSWGGSLDPIFGSLPPGSHIVYLTTSTYPGLPATHVVVQYDPENIGDANTSATVSASARAVRRGR